MVSDPDRAPGCVGEKTTCTAQLAADARVEAQELAAMAKSPVTAKVRAFRETPPLLVTVTTSGALVPATPQSPKLTLLGNAETPAGATPVPVNEIVWGRPYMSLIVRVPVSGPTCVGT